MYPVQGWCKGSLTGSQTLKREAIRLAIVSITVQAVALLPTQLPEP